MGSWWRATFSQESSSVWWIKRGSRILPVPCNSGQEPLASPRSSAGSGDSLTWHSSWMFWNLLRGMFGRPAFCVALSWGPLGGCEENFCGYLKVGYLSLYSFHPVFPARTTRAPPWNGGSAPLLPTLVWSQPSACILKGHEGPSRCNTFPDESNRAIWQGMKWWLNFLSFTNQNQGVEDRLKQTNKRINKEHF